MMDMNKMPGMDMDKFQLVVQLGMLKTLAKKVLDLVLQSTDQDLKIKIIKLGQDFQKSNPMPFGNISKPSPPTNSDHQSSI